MISPGDNPSGKEIALRRMRLADIPQVVSIEVASFPTPWSESTYRKELSGNPAAYLFVAERSHRAAQRNEIIGYVGFWFIVDEAHISTLAVRPDWRRKGLGRSILNYSLEQACRLGADLVTLEVRESNLGAIALYRALGFEERARRPGYYRDTDEDALVMYKEDLDLIDRQVRAELRES